MESNRIQKSRVTAILRTFFFRKKRKNERTNSPRSKWRIEDSKNLRIVIRIIRVHFEIATKLEEVKLIRL